MIKINIAYKIIAIPSKKKYCFFKQSISHKIAQSKEDVEAIIFLLYASYTQIMKNINTAVIFHLFFFKKLIKIIKTPHDSRNNFSLRL
jgi:hypothetical protein